MLKMMNIHKTFNAGTVNEKKALNGLDLTLEKGNFVALIGGNGAVKSTMLNARSGGQRQTLTLLMATLKQPKILRMCCCVSSPNSVAESLQMTGCCCQSNLYTERIVS